MPKCWRGFVSVVFGMFMLVMTSRISAWPGSLTTYACTGLDCAGITNTPTVVSTLNGTDQTVSYTLTLDLNNTTNLQGWQLTITSTRFTTASAPTHTLPASASSIAGVTAVCQSGQICAAMPVNIMTGYPIAVPAGNPAPTPVTFYDIQSGSGLGDFTISVMIHIRVPATAYKGDYTSTITLAFISGQ
jgi:hypothetical protein